MTIKLSDHFNTSHLLRFALPSVVMMVFTSVYGIVDGFCVSNFAGETQFNAVNIIFPYVMLLGAVGFMFGAGGSAIVGKTLGEGDSVEANKKFSFIVYCDIVCSVLLSIIGFVTVKPVANLLGASGQLLEYATSYGRILMLGLPFFAVQGLFQSFFVTAEKPRLGFVATVIAGCTNIVLDLVLVGLLKLGVVFAGIATVISQVVGASIALAYFVAPNSSLLRLGKCRFYGEVLLKAVTNGSSELLTNVALSIVNMLYNAQLLRFVGEDGVAAYGVLMYVGFFFVAMFIGYSVGVAPIASYNFGSGNKDELCNVFRKSIVIILISSMCMFLLGEVLARPLSVLFVSYNESLFQLTQRAFAIYSLSFLFSGISIYSSSFFTSLNDGLSSLIISFMRTLVLQVVCVTTLPLLLGVDGIWLSLPVSEFVSMAISVTFLLVKQRKLGYRLLGR